jgi:hypothetical protein
MLWRDEDGSFWVNTKPITSCAFEELMRCYEDHLPVCLHKDEKEKQCPVCEAYEQAADIVTSAW